MKTLARKLNTLDCVFIGLGAMMGSGIFASLSPAIGLAGRGVLISLALASFVAALNAFSMAKLASVYPESGGAYTYGRYCLGPFYGFMAGWCFVIGKVASCAAMALTFAHYVSPEYPQALALFLVLLLSLTNMTGIKKTARINLILILFVIAVLLSLSLFSLMSVEKNLLSLNHQPLPFDFSSVLGGAGLLFFAFAGYARVATLGEEVINPQKTIPLSILISLFLTTFIYALVILSLILNLELSSISKSSAPLLLLAQNLPPWVSLFIQWAAALASAGVLISLLAGISRTLFAMSRQGELPSFLKTIHPKYQTPYFADLLNCLLIALLILFIDLGRAISFSSFSILFYYAIANASAFTLKNNRFRYFAILALLSCLMIAFSLPTLTIGIGLGLLLVGAIVYSLITRFNFRNFDPPRP